MIKILLFAQLAEQAGAQSIDIDEEKTTTDDIRQFLKETYNLQGTDRAMIAVNEVYRRGNSEVKSGDTVALIPRSAEVENVGRFRHRACYRPTFFSKRFPDK